MKIVSPLDKLSPPPPPILKRSIRLAAHASGQRVDRENEGDKLNVPLSCLLTFVYSLIFHQHAPFFFGSNPLHKICFSDGHLQ